MGKNHDKLNYIQQVKMPGAHETSRKLFKIRDHVVPHAC